MSFKWIIRAVGIVFILLLTMVVFSNYTITRAAENKTFNDVNAIKKSNIGLLLGTSKYYKDGGLNLYFKYRIDAAVTLYRNGKIDFILVSGDNSSKYYNEPQTFKKELIKRGIPEAVIFLDYAGFRTLDSVIRAKAIFGQSDITVISQQFHNERAIYIAQKKGIKAVGFNAKDIGGTNGLQVKLREYFARTKAFLDIIFHVEPKFYGKEIKISKPEKNDSLKADSLDNK
ncbi:MAG: protein SanA [Aequorivita sp.]|nr:protein SanA [Aequorivita sp.]|tara:strand:+ start:797 stop:1483 length:687 start_codon:yes stop_codon:yes gene_type:complete